MRVFLICTLAATLTGVAGPSAWAASAGWVRPVSGPVLRHFAVGPDRFAAGQHRGVDLEAPPGARVGAVCLGRVTFAGLVPRGGRSVSVRCGRLVATLQHLGSVTVRRGQPVLPGDRVGTAGSAQPRPHVHLGARVDATGAYVDPLAVLNGAARPEPPLAPRARRSPRLGPAPRAGGRAPDALRVRVLEPRAARATPARAHPERLSWPVWLGLALFGIGLRLGGALTAGRRRRRVAAQLARTAA